MSQKSANIARRLFAAVPHSPDGRAVAPRPPLDSAKPLHKERKEEKEKIPLWRWYLYRIGEDCFRQLAFIQWRENKSDGMPDNPPACFQRKLTNALNTQSAAQQNGGAA